MRWGLVTSLVLHGAILAAALVVLPNPNKYEIKPQQAIQVDISKIEDVSKRKASAKTAEKPKEKPAPKKIEEVKKTEPAPKIAEEVKTAANEAKPEPPPPEPKKEEPKTEEPKKEEPKAAAADPLKDLIKETVNDTPEPKKAEPKKEEPKKAEAKPKEKPKKPDKKKEKLNPDEIAAFLNKIDEEKAAPAPETDKTAEPELAEVNLQGTDDSLSADIVDALVSRVKECWTVPPGAREARMSIRIHFQLNPDGSIIGVPQIENGGSDPLFDATARSAVSALIECQNYSFLPQDRYDLWKENTLDFNPNLMFDS